MLQDNLIYNAITTIYYYNCKLVNRSMPDYFLTKQGQLSGKNGIVTDLGNLRGTPGHCTKAWYSTKLYYSTQLFGFPHFHFSERGGMNSSQKHIHSLGTHNILSSKHNGGIGKLRVHSDHLHSSNEL